MHFSENPKQIQANQANATFASNFQANSSKSKQTQANPSKVKQSQANQADNDNEYDNDFKKENIKRKSKSFYSCFFLCDKKLQIRYDKIIL